MLIREIPFKLAIRLWDTYLAEGTRMREFLTYVLAAFLLTWSSQLKRMEFQVRRASFRGMRSYDDNIADSLFTVHHGRPFVSTSRPLCVDALSAALLQLVPRMLPHETERDFVMCRS